MRGDPHAPARLVARLGRAANPAAFEGRPAGPPVGRSVEWRGPSVQEWHKCAQPVECKRGSSDGIISCLRYADTSRAVHRQAAAYRRLRCSCRALAHPLGGRDTYNNNKSTAKSRRGFKRERGSARTTTTRRRTWKIPRSDHYHAPPKSSISTQDHYHAPSSIKKKRK